MEIGVGRRLKPAIVQQAAERAVKVPKGVCGFGVGILAHAEFLIPFGGHVNVEVVERAGFDLVGVLMAFPLWRRNRNSGLLPAGQTARIREKSRTFRLFCRAISRNSTLAAPAMESSASRCPRFSRSFSFLRYSSGNSLRSASSCWISESV